MKNKNGWAIFLALVLGCGLVVFAANYKDPVYPPGTLSTKDDYGISGTQNTNSSTPNLNRSIVIGENLISQDGIKFSLTTVNIGNTVPKSNSLMSLYSGKTTTGAWIVATMTENNSKDSGVELINQNQFILTDQNNRQYTADAWYLCGDTMEHTYSGETNFVLIKPAIPCVNKILFEVAKDSNAFTLSFNYVDD